MKKILLIIFLTFFYLGAFSQSLDSLQIQVDRMRDDIFEMKDNISQFRSVNLAGTTAVVIGAASMASTALIMDEAYKDVMIPTGVTFIALGVATWYISYSFLKFDKVEVSPGTIKYKF